ncbi:hypothetical protein M8A51_06490 [Schlegelella sp. S2-27]|uniref:Uncharacterized protein n=1 Tax=Caldimonas mangrovi TaxID=2944811 RepID=A0ABT0YKB4_9BURK|nr:hypothetical protein [Caldimonas mangrovi]MCM5679177.1 hypothetical protein [Caldimonas mangrovi]
MNRCRTAAHFVAAPPPAGWQEWLTQRLGRRPRRIGAWSELALYGAVQCLDLAGESTLPAGVALRVASLRGPMRAARACIEQSTSGLPMPFTFLQSQPSQLLAALSHYLDWQGDARLVVAREPAAVLALAQLEAGPSGVLLGWVEEEHQGHGMQTQWWRLVPE